jgi:hypothetical protein
MCLDRQLGHDAQALDHLGKACHRERRAALAMRQNWTNDTFKLARVALEAAVPDGETLLALLPAPAAPTRAPQNSAQSIADQGASVHAT